MSAKSGIEISKELSKDIAALFDEPASRVRFLKITIDNESLVKTASLEAKAETLEDDFDQLQDILEDNVPAYFLARASGQPTSLLVIAYVPDYAPVRAKMLYASTRGALMKALGSRASDALFATSRGDLTGPAYVAHRAHMSADQPLSASERELADMRAAELQESSAGGTGHRGLSARKNHLGSNVGLEWSDEASKAVSDLGKVSTDKLVVLSIDVPTETLKLSSTKKCRIDELSKNIPTSEPAYSFFAWEHKHAPDSSSRCDIVFIYTCPSSSSIKVRMLYAAGAASLYNHVKTSLLKDSPITVAPRKVEASDPAEITESFICSALGWTTDMPASTGSNESGPPEPSGAKLGSGEARFARPKGPGRKR